MVLEAQDEVGEDQPHQAEGEQGPGVAEPALLPGGVDAAQAVGEPLHGPDDAVQPRAAAGVEHLDQIEAEGLGDQEERADIERELQPGVGRVHGRRAGRVRSEFLREEDGGGEVAEGDEGEKADEEVFHGGRESGLQRIRSQARA